MGPKKQPGSSAPGPSDFKKPREKSPLEVKLEEINLPLGRNPLLIRIYGRDGRTAVNQHTFGKLINERTLRSGVYIRNGLWVRDESPVDMGFVFKNFNCGIILCQTEQAAANLRVDIDRFEPRLLAIRDSDRIWRKANINAGGFLLPSDSRKKASLYKLFEHYLTAPTTLGWPPAQELKWRIIVIRDEGSNCLIELLAQEDVYELSQSQDFKFYGPHQGGAKGRARRHAHWGNRPSSRT